MRQKWTTPGVRSASGQGLVELALALPVLLLILLVTVDLGRMFFDYIEMRNGAREAAGYLSRHPSTDEYGNAEAVASDHGLPDGADVHVECIPKPEPPDYKDGCKEPGGNAEAYVEITHTFTPVATRFLQTYFGIGPIDLTAEASMRVLS